MLGPMVRPGMKVADIGCAMGYFTLPLARLVGPEGKVVAVDLQPKMLAGLERRARRAGLADRIERRLSQGDSFGLDGLRADIDLAVLIHVAHEVPNRPALFAAIHEALKPGGAVLFAEPRGHVSTAAFEESLAMARACGFSASPGPRLRRAHTAVLRRVLSFSS